MLWMLILAYVYYWYGGWLLMQVSLGVCMVTTSTRGFALNRLLVLVLSYPVVVVGEDGSDQTWRVPSVVITALLLVAILYPVVSWLYYADGLFDFLFSSEIPGVVKIDVLFAPTINAVLGSFIGFVFYHLTVGVCYRVRF